MKSIILSIFIFSLFSIKVYTQNNGNPLYTKELADALEKKDFSNIQAILEKRNIRADDIVWGSKEAFMPLVFAIGFHLDDVAIELLSRQNYVNRNNQEGNLALQRACELTKVELVKMLIEKGADVNAFSAEGFPIFFETLDNLDLVKLFVEKGVDIHVKSLNGTVFIASKSTALHFASMNSSLPIIIYLMEKGANIHETNAKGWTPMHYAAYGGNTEGLLGLLANKADKYVKSTAEWEIMANEVQYPYPLGSTPLAVANILKANSLFQNKADEFEKIILILSLPKKD